MIRVSLRRRLKNRAEGKTQLNPYNTIAIAILITSLALYFPFIFGNQILAYRDMGYDTFHQYLPAYQFFANLFRTGNWGTYSFSYGVGTSIFTPISWISDPFALLNVLYGIIFGVEKIGGFLVYTQILKILAAGLLCLYFLKQYDLSERACVIASYIYAFSGYMMTAGQHYQFSVFPVYFVLHLALIERALKNRKEFFPLIFATALISLRGVYSAYMVLLASAVFVVARAVQITDRPVKEIVKDIMRIGTTMAFGLLLAAVLFLPSVGSILNSTRLSSGVSLLERIINSFSIADPAYIRSCFLRLFSNSLEGTVNGWKGAQFHWEMFSCFFSALLVPLIAQFVWATFAMKKRSKTRAARVLAVAALIGSAVFWFVPNLFNVFAEASYRFAFVFLPFFAFVVAETIGNIEKGVGYNRKLNYLTTGISCVFVTISTYRVYQLENNVVFPLFIATGSLVAGSILLDLRFLSSALEPHHPQSKKLQHTLSVLLVVVIALNLFGENMITLYSGRTIATKASAEHESATAVVSTLIGEMEQDNFYRMETDLYEEDMPDALYSLTTPFRSLSYYDTVVNSYLPEFMRKMFSNDAFHTQIYKRNDYGDKLDEVTADLLGLKYYIAATDYSSSGWEKVDLGLEQPLRLYRNSDLDSAGLLFEYYISEESADDQTVAQRRLGIAQRLIIDNVPANIADFGAEMEDAITSSEGICNYVPWTDQVVLDKMLFSADGTVNMSGVSSTSGCVCLELDSSMIDVKDQQTQLTIKASGQYPVRSIRIKINDWWEEHSHKEVDSIDGGYSYSFILPQRATGVAFYFKDDTPFDLCVSLSTAKENYTNNGVHLDNPQMGGFVTGTVTAEKPSLFFVPIPYDDSWTAYLDGNEVEILKANYAFCALEMPEGTHSVEFVYHNQFFEIGAIISAATLIAIICVYISVVKRRKRRSDDIF